MELNQKWCSVCGKRQLPPTPVKSPKNFKKRVLYVWTILLLMLLYSVVIFVYVQFVVILNIIMLVPFVEVNILVYVKFIYN